MKNLISTSGYCIIVVFAIITSSCTQGTGKNNAGVFADTIYLKNAPPQPGVDSWHFIEDLKAPMWTKHPWGFTRPEPRQADLSGGVNLKAGFADPKKRLETAYDDLRSFLAAGDVKYDNGAYTIETAAVPNMESEAFRIECGTKSCRILASDIEGIRRGIFHLEDEMLSHRGPYLSLGSTKISPFIKRRISRCFFGPIKRPPAMRDELMDTVDYYPDQYLNRLAHEGVNGLWLTIEFRDLVATRYTPDAAKDGAKRLAKLKKTAEKCLRYGIRTYIFCIEPRAWDSDSPVIKKYPELAGAPNGRGNFFCPISQTAHNYLYETVNKIFKAVPDLGGLINITYGERGTTCLSSVSSMSEYHIGQIDCPRCSHKEPWQILHASLSAMEQGMHDAAPGAELISWLYIPQPQRYVTGDSYSLADWVYELAAHTPKGVILQYNFESGVTRTEFGKLLVGGDYWISNPGPSDRFERIATVARKYGTEVSAKIQTGNSHEVATVPFVPVPSLLYQKFSGMKRLGVTYTMLCWYFGNYPGLMNKAAGLLSMEPFPDEADSFLNRLASINWKKEDVSKVVDAWKLFSKGYENYPLVNLFQYYGPIHDGPVWPLFLKPVDAPLSPTWQIGSSTTLKPWPPSGDRVGECIGDVLTLEEVVELTKRMTESWNKGMEILKVLENNYTNEPERLLDIGVAQALGIQLRSGYNILNFYYLREKMLRMEGKERLDILNKLSEIINDEIIMDEQLLVLCEKDSRLGFHSEAEGYKYFPEKIRWRIGQLKNVLEKDVPAVKEIIGRDQPLFPEYTGKKPSGPVADCIVSDGVVGSGTDLVLPKEIKWQICNFGADKSSFKWSALYGKEALYIVVSENGKEATAGSVSPISSVEVKIEPQRLYPAGHFVFSRNDENSETDPVHILGYPLLYRGSLKEYNIQGVWTVAFRIPFQTIGLKQEDLHPIRMDVIVQKREGGKSSWRPNNPTTPRLILGSDNPADLGWLLFKK